MATFKRFNFPKKVFEGVVVIVSLNLFWLTVFESEQLN